MPWVPGEESCVPLPLAGLVSSGQSLEYQAGKIYTSTIVGLPRGLVSSWGTRP